MYAGHKGDRSMDVAEAISMLTALTKVEWKMIYGGNFVGSRYFECEHGIVVQRPEPINEMCLFTKEIATTLGVIPCQSIKQ